jgi:hypothetical protein
MPVEVCRISKRRESPNAASFGAKMARTASGGNGLALPRMEADAWGGDLDRCDGGKVGKLPEARQKPGIALQRVGVGAKIVVGKDAIGEREDDASLHIDRVVERHSQIKAQPKGDFNCSDLANRVCGAASNPLELLSGRRVSFRERMQRW